jgi:3-deoxy-D-manno-octulosonic-acid transferase
VQAGVAIQFRNAQAFARRGDPRLLSDPEASRAQGEAAAQFCAEHRGATARIMDLIQAQERSARE